ncbi:MAG: TapB family protein [bacterium]
MKKLLVYVPIALLIIGCGGGEKNYFPLTEGNTWNYRTISTTTIGDSTLSDTGTVKMEITAKTTLNNGTEVYEQILTIDQSGDTSYMQETDDYLLSYDDKADTKPDTILAFPLEEGKTWTVSKDSLYTETSKAMGKESVTVPAGTYDDCWKIADILSDSASSETTFYYLAPDVGLIKLFWSMTVDTNVTSKFTMELESATIK